MSILTTPNLDELIQHDRVHGSLYTDRDLFAAELEDEAGFVLCDRVVNPDGAGWS